MYARSVQRPTQRRSQLKMFPAPTAGWISNRALAVPNDGTQVQGAAVLDNFFPRSTGVVLRRGKRLHATLGNGTLDSTSLFSYNNGEVRKLFASTKTTIYDITDVPFASDVEISTEVGELIVDEDDNWFGWGSTTFLAVLSGLTGGDWIVVQFATTGGVFLIGVNGMDDGFVYDGDRFYPYIAGGVSRIQFKSGAGAFSNGATVTGATSGASATIYRAKYSTVTKGYLLLTDIVGGPFEDGETLADNEGAAAEADGVDEIAAPGVTFPGDLTTADMSFVWAYKNRLWFSQKNSLNAWYIDDVDAIGGEAVAFPLAGVMGLGGSLLFGQSWSLEGGAEGGLSEQNIFCTTEGEVAIYQGIYPGELETWSKVGVYRIGKPLGHRAFVRGGGDLAIATSVGLVPLSKAISLDITSLNVATVSYNIADAWNDAVSLRGLVAWQGEIWPEAKMALFAPPTSDNEPHPVTFVSNTETGAWARYTDWHALSMEVFGNVLYFGSPKGKVFIANATGADDGQAYTGSILPLFDDMGSPASAKVAKVGRAVVRASAAINGQVDFRTDYDMTLPIAPAATGIANPSGLWDAGVWGSSSWGVATNSIINQDWQSIAGIGYSCSLAFQVTSGAVQPLDVEIVRIEALYDTAEMVT